MLPWCCRTQSPQSQRSTRSNRQVGRNRIMPQNGYDVMLKGNPWVWPKNCGLKGDEEVAKAEAEGVDGGKLSLCWPLDPARWISLVPWERSGSWGAQIQQDKKLSLFLENETNITKERCWAEGGSWQSEGSSYLDLNHSTLSTRWWWENRCSRKVTWSLPISMSVSVLKYSPHLWARILHKSFVTVWRPKCLDIFSRWHWIHRNLVRWVKRSTIPFCAERNPISQ